ncbi:MAG: hypothetical protein FVQ83_09820 [Chloroflexi bacterium]|nr:hypothetical protein [Chloroflexota bacterium]
MKKILITSVLLLFVGAILSACGGDADLEARVSDLESSDVPASTGLGLDASTVTFDISIIEIKGATDGIEQPSVDPTTLSDGYRFKPAGEYDADNPDKWQVSTYLFSPSALTVAVGDSVTLRTFVINGDEHTIWLEAPDGSTVASTELTMNRGREYNISFTADQAGYYTLHCDEHEPTMSMIILSLPN